MTDGSVGRLLRIRAAIDGWDRTTSKGQGPGEFAHLLSDRERNELAQHIERSVFGDDGSGAPTYAELIQAEADARAELKELRGEVHDLCAVLVRDGGDYLEDRSGGGYIDVLSVPLIVAIIREPALAAREGGQARE